MASSVNISAQDVINFIWSGEFNNDARRRIVRALNEQSRMASAQAASRFCRGDRVQFITKHGANVTGTVTKVNRMTVFITADGSGAKWRVSPALLSHFTGK